MTALPTGVPKGNGVRYRYCVLGWVLNLGDILTIFKGEGGDDDSDGYVEGPLPCTPVWWVDSGMILVIHCFFVKNTCYIKNLFPNDSLIPFEKTSFLHEISLLL